VTLAQSVAHREPPAALSQGPDSLLQSHFFVFNPISTRRRIVPAPRVSAIIYFGFTVVEEAGASDVISTLAGE
jgi:hypothetical protein